MNKSATDLAALLVETSSAICEVRAAVGAPGDYGYGTREGAALFELYKLLPRIAAAAKAQIGSPVTTEVSQ